MVEGADRDLEASAYILYGGAISELCFCGVEEAYDLFGCALFSYGLHLLWLSHLSKLKVGGKVSFFMDRIFGGKPLAILKTTPSISSRRVENPMV